MNHLAYDKFEHCCLKKTTFSGFFLTFLQHTSLSLYTHTHFGYPTTTTIGICVYLFEHDIFISEKTIER